MRCNKCNNIIEKIPAKLICKNPEGCYICSGKNKHKTTDFFKKELNEKFPETFKVLSEYKNARTPIKVLRLKCGHINYISPDNLLRGKGCPACGIRQSSYMNQVEKYLQDNNIEFIKEKRFEECRNIKTLPFDYYLPKYNCCIEVDGEFHYKNFEKRNSSNTVQMRDNIKTNFCLKNNIELIRLPYFEFKKNNQCSFNYIKILNDKLHINSEITK